MNMFQKAERRKSKARILIEGPSGSGKTFGALKLAKGLGQKVAVVDTEHGSASMYAHLLDFDVLNLDPPYSPKRFIEAIHAAEAAGYDVLIIDSITHEWSGEGGVLDIKDKLPGASDWAKWRTVTPMHSAFIEAMLQSPIHIIATTRSKTEWAIDSDGGKSKPSKIGTSAQQREGIDYEFTIVFSVQQENHVAHVTKDRTNQFDGFLEVITEKTGQRIKDWLESGAEPAPVQKPAPELSPVEDMPALREEFARAWKLNGFPATKSARATWLEENSFPVEFNDLTPEDLSRAVELLFSTEKASAALLS